MDFETIKSRIEDNLLDLPAETQNQIGDWVNIVIREAEDRHNFRYMEATFEATTTEDTRKLDDLPGDWKEANGDPWLLRDDGDTQEIRWAPSESDMLRLYSDDPDLSDGEPEFILEKPEELWVYPFPDGDSDYTNGEYRLKIPYWAYAAELSENADTNWWTSNYPLYVIHRASAYGFLHNRDSQRATEQGRIAENVFLRAKKVDNRSKLPRRMSLQFTTGVYAPSVQPRPPQRLRRWRR